jgi:murein L,D-transpeptidase YcbB/YkuD
VSIPRLLVLLCLLSGCGVLGRYDDGDDLVSAVRLRVDKVAPLAGGDPDDAAVRRFYEARRYQPAWSGDRTREKRGREALAVVLRSGTHGLDPALYRAEALRKAAEALSKDANLEGRAAFEVDLTRALTQFAGDLDAGRIRPSARQWKNAPPRQETDRAALLERAARSDDPGRELEAAAPAAPAYTRLRELLARLHGVASAGGWGSVPPGPALAAGSSGPRVVALRHRLGAEGEVPLGQGAAFDEALAAGVRRFQERHGLEATGRVDEATLKELNVPVEQRIRTVELNLERWRWMPRDPTTGARTLLVNIPTFELRLLEGDRTALAMAVVVGKSWTPTPVFSDAITSVVLNPTWNVPASITKGEIAPAVSRDPGYLARHQMRLFRGEEEVDPASVDWEGDLDALSVRQEPGDQNALGKIKFLMPNKFDVYLHDTPAGHLFSRAERDFSHGCIRLEKPLDLALALLRDRGEWPGSRVSEVLASGETTEVKLPAAVPVHITYFTVEVAEGGAAFFGPDVYNLDRELAAALARRRPDATIARGLLRSEQHRL